MGNYGIQFGNNWNHITLLTSINSKARGRRGRTFDIPQQKQEVLQIERVHVKFEILGTPVRTVTTRLSLRGDIILPLIAKLGLKGAASKHVRSGFHMKGAALKDIKTNLVLRGKQDFSNIKAVLMSALYMLDEEKQ